ncbi:DUF4124 domain-containing protein [Microbulbifer zhoushanensis]|nr:DUF4124 domain-containing protein [Microbulbifer zhoushanensis]
MTTNYNKGHPMRFLSAILLASLACTAYADGIYKWTDENGVVHFGSQPPQKKAVEVVKEPKSQRYRQWKQEQDALAKAAEGEGNEESPLNEAGKRETGTNPDVGEDTQLTQAQKSVRLQRCRQAQTNLQELTAHSRVREVDASGKIRVLPEDERQARIRQTRETIARDC